MNFDYFWFTTPNVEKHSNGEFVGFRMFDATHLSELILLAVVCIVMGILYHKMGEKARKNTLITVAGLCIADEIFKHVVCLATGQHEWQYLPLHLCSINIFVILSYVIKPSKMKAELLYALCLPGAFLALVSPSWMKAPLLNFMHLHSYTVHVLLVLFPILLLAGGFKPDFKRLPKCLLFLVIACVFIYPLNKLLDTNFMFLNGTSNVSILKLIESFLGNPGYLAALPVLLIIFWVLMYTPWIIAERCAKTKKDDC